MVSVHVASQTRAGWVFRRLTTGKSNGGLDQMFDSRVAPKVAVEKISSYSAPQQLANPVDRQPILFQPQDPHGALLRACIFGYCAKRKADHEVTRQVADRKHVWTRAIGT